MSKLAIIFPGIGYHKDKPLLYYSSKLMMSEGFDIINIEYHDLPHKVKGDAAMMKKAFEIAFAQSEEQLSGVDYSAYEEVVFIGKSIGTAVVAKYVAELNVNAVQVWYTPVEATFAFEAENVIAFIGDDDPWSDVARVKSVANDKGIPIYSYPKCNHSLECDDVLRNIEILDDVIKKTKEYIMSAF